MGGETFLTKMENPEHLRNKIDVFHQPEIKHIYIENYTLTKVKKKKKRLGKIFATYWTEKKCYLYCAQRE